ncbi:hypothetical protein GCM10025865_15770 [Paraoerskovia sediminicola]|uniref:PKD domain-containing protein n=1 Tax=Paraoerskovia sediminicola TaxID=1138587 RepID=A0ABM8G2E9_9CELL|nr:DUF6318 family protein [Paraoerskovia sediminicola]BDZ42278.1 hypothetical protein GCM10025865_15770 [Paraoerskovia sediminicola]
MDFADERGAEAAAVYFLALYPYVMATGDTAEWDAMSFTETCDFCVEVVDDAKEIRTAGNSFVGGGLALSDIQVHEQDTLIGGYPVTARYVQAVSIEGSRAGAPMKETPRQRATYKSTHSTLAIDGVCLLSEQTSMTSMASSTRAALVVVVTTSLILTWVTGVTATNAAADEHRDRSLFGTASGSQMSMEYKVPARRGQATRSEPQSPTLTDFRRVPEALCSPLDTTSHLRDDCDVTRESEGGAPECAIDELARDPLFTRSRESVDHPWGPWTPVRAGRCLTAADLAPEMEREFRALPITPPTMTVQPPSGWTLVHFDTIAYTESADATAQTFDISLLGVPVEVRAESSEFAFDFGDGSAPVVTTDPGAPYPDQTVTHSYSDVGRRTISLSTTWTGQFRIAGTPTWSDITGTAETTSVAPPIDVVEARSRLVGSTLD